MPVSYAVKEAETPVTLKGAFGSSSALYKKIAALPILRISLTEKAGRVQKIPTVPP